MYVDDILYASKDESKLKNFEDFLKAEYKFQVGSELKEYVRFQIRSSRDCIRLSAEVLIQEMAEKYGLNKTRNLNNHLPSGGVQVAETDILLNEEQRVKFQSLIGGLLYIGF